MNGDTTTSAPTMTHAEMAKKLGISGQFLSNLVRDGRVSPQRFGSFPVYSEDDLAAMRSYLDSRRRGRRSDMMRPVGLESDDSYMSAADAAELLGVSARTISRWVELGRVTAWHQGLLRRDVEAMAEQLRPKQQTA